MTIFLDGAPSISQQQFLNCCLPLFGLSISRDSYKYLKFTMKVSHQKKICCQDTAGPYFGTALLCKKFGTRENNVHCTVAFACPLTRKECVDQHWLSRCLNRQKQEIPRGCLFSFSQPAMLGSPMPSHFSE